MAIAPQDRLIVALDFPNVAEARDLVARVGDAVTFYKVGLELVLRGGLDLVRELKSEGRKVFLDMKLLDIPNTVEKAVASAAAHGVDLLTVHAIDTPTAKAAVAGAAGSQTKLLCVTVMTSVTPDALVEQGIAEVTSDLVVRRAELACSAGIHGVIASGHEAKALRMALGADKLVVTPGIRLPSDAIGDQARVSTPASAIRDGADKLVVGRPITATSDPRAAALRFHDEIASAL